MVSFGSMVIVRKLQEKDLKAQREPKFQDKVLKIKGRKLQWSRICQFLLHKGMPVWGIPASHGFVSSTIMNTVPCNRRSKSYDI